MNSYPRLTRFKYEIALNCVSPMRITSGEKGWYIAEVDGQQVVTATLYPADMPNQGLELPVFIYPQVAENNLLVGTGKITGRITDGGGNIAYNVLDALACAYKLGISHARKELARGERSIPPIEDILKVAQEYEENQDPFRK